MSCGDMKSDRVSRTSNQLPSTNEKMPAVYTTHKIVNRFLCLRTRVPECQVTNKVNKKRDKHKHRSHGKKKIPKHFQEDQQTLKLKTDIFCTFELHLYSLITTHDDFGSADPSDE